MRFSVIFIWLIFLSGCSTTMTERVQKQVAELHKEAVEKLGPNHGYYTSVLAGAKSVWAGKTCLDFFSKKVDFNSDNTRISLERGTVETAIQSALRGCGLRGNGVCIPVMVNNDCVLGDEAQKGTPEVIQSQASPPRFSEIELQKAKDKCIELGFNPGTEDFGQCVLKISK